MPIDRTGVATAAVAASLALDLLSKVIEVSKPVQQDEWLAAARREADTLRRAADEDVTAYNVYLQCARTSAGPEEQERALRGTIEVPMNAARAAVAGIELCVAMADSVRASVTADLGVAAALLAGAVRGMMLCVDANLPATAAHDLYYEAVRTERRDLEERANRSVSAVVARATSAESR
ncbi:MAG TPA: cyclodeaminase/cyclohydrolase family protein [Bryobacteraceae bacterium]|nr:cyclodeaminase/cyclohydrolase family protein [Bryobacteraceae bacterium]